MSAQAESMDREADMPKTSSGVPALEKDQGDALSEIFLVTADSIDLREHPLSPHHAVLHIHYPVALNIPAAVARYINNNTNIYPAGTIENFAEIPHYPNNGAYVGGRPANCDLFLTIIPGSIDEFISTLRYHAANIAYAIKQPSVLFTIRHDQPFATAKRMLEKSFNPFANHTLG